MSSEKRTVSCATERVVLLPFVRAGTASREECLHELSLHELYHRIRQYVGCMRLFY